ncbi:MAG: pyruvate kinase, partial [Polyangia bacterium]|nr:pyruvate kinase [Polyangia bacterium]
MRRTKIVGTIGPASLAPDVLDRLLGAGVDVARLNFSHGEPDVHRQAFDAVRAAARRVGKEVAILQDLQGPKIRAGRLQGGKMTLSAGQEILIAPGADQTDPQVIPTVYDALPRDVVSGDR